ASTTGVFAAGEDLRAVGFRTNAGSSWDGFTGSSTGPAAGCFTGPLRTVSVRTSKLLSASCAARSTGASIEGTSGVSGGVERRCRTFAGTFGGTFVLRLDALGTGGTCVVTRTNWLGDSEGAISATAWTDSG